MLSTFDWELVVTGGFVSTGVYSASVAFTGSTDLKKINSLLLIDEDDYEEDNDDDEFDDDEFDDVIEL